MAKRHKDSDHEALLESDFSNLYFRTDSNYEINLLNNNGNDDKDIKQTNTQISCHSSSKGTISSHLKAFSCQNFYNQLLLASKNLDV